MRKTVKTALYFFYSIAWLLHIAIVALIFVFVLSNNFDVNNDCEKLLIILNGYKYSMIVSFTGMIIVFLALNMSKKEKIEPIPN